MSEFRISDHMPPFPVFENVGTQIKYLSEERDAARVEAEQLRKLLRLYARDNDCPVCFAAPRLVGVKVTPMRGENYATSGGRWEVEHGASCDVGRALQRQSEPKTDR